MLMGVSMRLDHHLPLSHRTLSQMGGEFAIKSAYHGSKRWLFVIVSLITNRLPTVIILHSSCFRPRQRGDPPHVLLVQKDGDGVMLTNPGSIIFALTPMSSLSLCQGDSEDYGLIDQCC
jgi:hypothetical protein